MSDTEEPTNEPAGKIEISSPHGNRNALVHGVYASELVLPWECAEDFQRLHDDLKVEWTPDGRQEQGTVLSLARWNWLKHRLMRSTQIAFRRDPHVAELEKSGVTNWPEVESFLQQKAAADDVDIMGQVNKTLQDLQDATKTAGAVMTATDSDSQKIYKEVQTVQEMFQRLMPVYQAVFDLHQKKSANTGGNKSVTNALIGQAYHPDFLDKIVRTEALIDARIDKNLQRIVTLKEYKRLVRQSATTVSSPLITPPVTDGV